jgi:hypothetical protein
MSGTISSHSYLVSGALERTILEEREGLGYHGPSGRKFSNRPNYDRLGSVVLAPSLGLTLTLGFPLSLFGI